MSTVRLISTMKDSINKIALNFCVLLFWSMIGTQGIISDYGIGFLFTLFVVKYFSLELKQLLNRSRQLFDEAYLRLE